MRKILNEPLFHFFILGTLLFIIYGFLNQNNEDSENYTIHLSKSDVERIEAAYLKSWNAPPDSSTLQNLINDEIKAEIFYREALRMNLDHNDEIIRRRLKQKYEFLVKDLVSYDEPTEEALLKFYNENAANYKSAKKVSFSQIYFSPDKREKPKKAAIEALEIIDNQEFKSEFKKMGDAFHLQSFYAKRDYEAIWQLFGKDFTEVLFQYEELGWKGPIYSGYGYHLVYLSNIEKEAVSSYEKVKDDVREDWKQRSLKLYNEQLFQNLREKYEVSYE